MEVRLRNPLGGCAGRVPLNYFTVIDYATDVRQFIYRIYKIYTL